MTMATGKKAVRGGTAAGERARSPAGLLPEPLDRWFAARGWSPRPHQLALLGNGRAGHSTLLIAPTGAGKTLGGFLPTLDDLIRNPERSVSGSGLHTLYISPLKALAVDIHRNLSIPVAEMGLPVRIETRSGDTSQAKRQRQRLKPPHILLTTPEQLALLLSHEESRFLFADLRTVVLDELHALAASKRGDLLALGLARLRALAPGLMNIGLSATVARPTELRAFLVPQTAPDERIEMAHVVELRGGATPEISILEARQPLPWAGHTCRYAVPDLLDVIRQHRLSLLFVNTRMQAELLFQELWAVNEENLPIALHHGSLDAGQRRKVEAAMAEGRLRAVVCTSTLDLGIDWGDVDLVVNVGAPKGASRFIQRVGRANHRLDEPSKALLVPSNRFEVLECRAALDAARAGSQDAVLSRSGARDVLAQHVVGRACAGPFVPDDLYREVRSASPYCDMQRAEFDRIVDFAATGGYALRVYERYARLKPDGGSGLRLAHPRLAQQHRMNIGTIVESPMLKVRLIGRKGLPKPGRPLAVVGGRVLGEIDEYFAGELSHGDTFVFAGQILRFEGIRENDAYVSRATGKEPKVPSYPGGKFPLSTHLAERVRDMLAGGADLEPLPGPVAEWLAIQEQKSIRPSAGEVLVETFPRAKRYYLVAYPFEGRLAHQTLGMLLTRRLHRSGAQPLGFVANDYALAVWSAKPVGELIAGGALDLDLLFDEDMLGDDLEAWLAESNLMKRTFRMCAVIAGLIERRHPGREKTGRQMTASSDLIYDVLRKHDPRHVLLEAAWVDASAGLLDIGRLGAFLSRIKGRIRHVPLGCASPLSIPILLEIGRETVLGASLDDLLRDAADELVAEALG
jgi:ATP-dependent helicase Lhr and Lhr-like helicase